MYLMKKKSAKRHSLNKKKKVISLNILLSILALLANSIADRN